MYSNPGPTSHRFRDFAHFCAHDPPYTPYSTLTLGVFPLDQIVHDRGYNIYLKLISREIIFEVF